MWATRQDDASFERAYLNVWPRPSRAVAAAGLELAAWSAAAHPDLVPRPAALALDVSADRSWASLAVAGPSDDGRLVVEVVEHRPGVGWLAGAVKAARARHRGIPIVADALVAASIVAELRRARVTVDPLGASDHAKACGTFVDLLAAGALAHRSQAVLDDAVNGRGPAPARRRLAVVAVQIERRHLPARRGHARRLGGARPAADRPRRGRRIAS